MNEEKQTEDIDPETLQELKRLTESWLHAGPRKIEAEGVGGQTSQTYEFIESWQKLQPLLADQLPSLIAAAEENRTLKERVLEMEAEVQAAARDFDAYTSENRTLRERVAYLERVVSEFVEETGVSTDDCAAGSDVTIKAEPFNCDPWRRMGFVRYEMPSLAAYLRERTQGDQ